ncbi:MAG: NAD-dependent epimerase/dehydratase family protein [Caldisphaera sp.]
MKILVTGCGGYIGTTLVPYLLKNGNNVRCVDRFFFGEDIISHFSKNEKVEIFKEDIRNVNIAIMNDIDAVVDMAALSNDPSGDLKPELTLSINYKGRVRIAKLAKEAGVKKYILMSSCSVYGFRDDMADENSEPNPLTTYAKANILAEKDILPLNNEKFNPIALRLSTVYGPSKRMRFDILVNGMSVNAYQDGKITVMRDGNQRRPLVHVFDVARAIYKTLAAEKDIGGEIINIGHEDQNYKVLDVARAVEKVIGGEISMYGDPDTRSYAVKFKKARDLLDFVPIFNVEDGVKQIYHDLLLGNLKQDPRWITVKWYKSLLEKNPMVLDA